MPHRPHTTALAVLTGTLAILHPPQPGAHGRTGPAQAVQAARRGATAPKEFKELQRLTSPAGDTWQLLEGPGLGGELPGRALYVRPLADSVAAPPELRPWHMPGRLLDAHSGESYYEAEVFVGEVLRDTVGIIWYDRSLMPDGLWRENTLLLNLTGPRPDTLVWFGQGRKGTTQSLAFRGKCQLLKGRDQQPVVE